MQFILLLGFIITTFTQRKLNYKLDSIQKQGSRKINQHRFQATFHRVSRSPASITQNPPCVQKNFSKFQETYFSESASHNPKGKKLNCFRIQLVLHQLTRREILRIKKLVIFSKGSLWGLKFCFFQ